jgi:hypothetical protein
MADLRARVCRVIVGPAAADSVPSDRLAFYRWLMPSVMARRRCQIIARNTSLSTEEMTSNPAIIKDLLGEENPDSDTERSAAVIDLAENPYYLLGEFFLFHVADMARRWIASRHRQTVVILMPGSGLPPPASLFWHPLPRESGSDRLIVIANDGTMWPATPERPPTKLDYVMQRNRSRNSLTEQLEMKIVRKPGHFDLGAGTADQKHCTRYFFDTEQAEQEIGELIVEWAKRTLLPRIPFGEPLTLASHGRESPSFHDAVAGAATNLGCRICQLNDDGSLPDPAQISGWVAPVLNIVNTGAIFRQAIESLRRAGASIAPEALAVMATGGNFSSGAIEKVNLTCLCGPYNREKVERSKCEQCSLGLPHTPAHREQQIGVRSFDMWSMLLEADWKRESYGAPPKQLYNSLPDLRQVFSRHRHGNYFAYKVHRLLENLGAGSEVAFVYPAEANIEELIVRLGVLLQNRQVAVRVPPAVIRGRNLNHELDRRSDEEWHRQLRHLKNQHFPRAVIIDEFAGSKLTADGLARLLRAFDLEPFAYVPIIDLSPERTLPGIPTYPLYRIPYPRNEHG